MGRKRHVVVDTTGMLLGVLVTAASLSDKAGARILLKSTLLTYGWLRKVWADAAYGGRDLLDTMRAAVPRRGFDLEIVRRSDLARGKFVVQPRRWVVERTFAWLSFNRRLAKDYETKPDHSAAFLFLASSRLMLRRLTR